MDPQAHMGVLQDQVNRLSGLSDRDDNNAGHSCYN